jgi:hypothetical protein
MGVVTLEELAALVDRFTRRVAELERATGLFATNGELDAARGDPEVKFAPRGWRGPSFVGKPFSACAPDFLEQLAESLQYAAEHPQPGKEKFAPYNRADARRARSWARRLRAGWKAATPEKAAASPPGARPAPTGRPATTGRPRAPGRPPKDHVEPDPVDDEDDDFLMAQGDEDR